VYAVTRLHVWPNEEPNETRLKILRLLRGAFKDFIVVDSELQEMLRHRFLDASRWRDTMPNSYVAVPDIVHHHCRDRIGPECHFGNLDPDNDDRVYREPKWDVKWDYRSKYMYSEEFQAQVIDRR